MKPFLPFLFLLFVLNAGSGQQTIRLSGKVVDAAGNPVAGAQVKLQKKNIATLSSAGGTYLVDWNTGICQGDRSPPPRGATCTIAGDRLVFPVNKGDRFCIEVFDTRGRLLGKTSGTAAGTGTHAEMRPWKKARISFGLLRLTVGAERTLYAVCSALNAPLLIRGNDNGSASAGSGTMASAATNDSLPILDTLVAKGNGFTLNNSVMLYVYAYIDTMDFALGEPDSFSAARQQCVHRINTYRASLHLNHLARNTSAEPCADSQCVLDFQSGTAHGAFGKCREGAQDECPGWSGPTAAAAANNIITGCLQQMWNEGPGTPYSEHGHYINMSNTSYTKCACGFYYSASKRVIWAIQNFWK